MVRIKKAFIILLAVIITLSAAVPALAVDDGLTPIFERTDDNDACDIDSSFPITTQNDGKVWVNKAVSNDTVDLKQADGSDYTGVELDALSAGNDDFAVSLMALAQSYKKYTNSEERTKLNIVFSIDISTSMSNTMLTGVGNAKEQRINVLKNAAYSFIDRLSVIGDETTVNLAIVVYNGTARTILNWSQIGTQNQTTAANTAEANNAITNCGTKTTSSKYYLSCANTNAQAGLYLSKYLFTTATDRPANIEDENVQNFLIFMTDGGPNRSFDTEEHMPVTTNANGYYFLPGENSRGLSRTITCTDYRKNAATSAFEQVEDISNLNNMTIYTLGLSEWFTTDAQDSRFPTAVNFMKLCAAVGNKVKDVNNVTLTAQAASELYAGEDVKDGAMPGSCPSYPVLDANTFYDGSKYTIRTSSNTYTDSTYNAFLTRYTNMFGDFEARNLSGIKYIEENLDYSITNYYAGNTSAKFNASFQNIAYHIILSVNNFVTEVETTSTADVSGYVGIIDDIGEYMEVKEIKGVLYQGTLYGGSGFSQIFSSLDWLSEDNVIYDSLRRSLYDRCGIPSSRSFLTDIFSGAIAARTIYYNNENDYSSYLYWYAYENHRFAGSYYNSNGEVNPVPTNARYLIKSYFAWGSAKGSTETNTEMFYITIAVAEDLTTDVQSVYFNVPASLLPVRTVDVHAVNDKNVAYISTNALPISLHYTVGLKDNVTETRDNYPYYNSTTSTWSFYTNAWDSVAYPGSFSSYAFYNPAADNPYYFATEDTLVYTKSDNGSSYVPATTYDVNTTYYYSETYYDETGVHNTYTELTQNLESIGSNINASNYIYINDVNGYLYKKNGAPKITQYNSASFSKNIYPEGNATGTNPMLKTTNFVLDENIVYRNNISSSVINILGNNGRLDLNTTNITITKVWDDADDLLGYRPESLTYEIRQDGVYYDTVTFTADDCQLIDGKWVYTVENIPFGYDYTVNEVNIPRYSTTYSDDSMTVTNTFILEQDVALDYGLPATIPLPDNINDVLVNSYKLNTENSTSNYGTFALAGSSISYNPTTTAWNGYDVIKYDMMLNDAKHSVVHGAITIMPATNVYYEENFLNFTNGSDASWITAGVTDAEAKQDGSDSYIYGFDPEYADNKTYSNGSAKKVTASNINPIQTWPEATFEMYGTMVEFISCTGADTGLIVVDITNAETGTRVKRVAVDTYYEDAETYGDIYQIPVLRCDMGIYGHYNIKISTAYSGYFDHNNSGSDDAYIDAVRIYNPAGTNLTSGKIHDKYLLDNELNPRVAQLRDTLLSSDAEVESDKTFQIVNGATGSMYVAHNPHTGTGGSLITNLALYKTNGPNHEVYLERGDAIAFKINDYSGNEKLHVSAKVPDINGKDSAALLAINGKMISYIDTASEQYYDVSDYVTSDGVVVITNNGKGILSLVDFKLVDGGEIITNNSVMDEAIEILAIQEETINAFSLPETLAFNTKLIYGDKDFDFTLNVPNSKFTINNIDNQWTATAVVYATDSQIMDAEFDAGIAADYTPRTEYRVLTAVFDGSGWMTQDVNFKYITKAEQQQNEEAMQSINIILKIIIDFFTKFFITIFS